MRGPSPSEPVLTRRALIRGAAGGAAALAATSLPAWARPVAAAAGVRRPDTLPFPHLPPGTEGIRQIEHVVVLMMENQSFDGVLGMVPGLDGLTVRRGRATNFNPGPSGGVYAEHMRSPCQLPAEPSQAWNASHISWNRGRNNGFVRASGPIAMRFWDRRDLPFTYSLADHFAVGERYFCSVLAQTYPNRRFFFAASASGTIDDKRGLGNPAPNGTIFDRLDAHRISWASYYQNVPSALIVPGVAGPAGRAAHFHKFDHFYADVAAGKLPAFTFLDPNYGTTSEENPQDIQVGEEFVAKVVRALMHAPTWKRTAVFITYDEHGGYYDHVPPPRAIKPDSTPPMLQPGDVPGAYDRYGFRVPLIVVSPWARPRHRSRVVQDHTSLLAFIERKWNLPAMTFRDANADPMLDYFDFRKRSFAKPPPLAHAPALGPGLAACHRAGLHPPLPTSPVDG